MNKFDYNDWYCLILHEISRRKKVKNFQERNDSNFSKQSKQSTFWAKKQGRKVIINLQS